MRRKCGGGTLTDGTSYSYIRYTDGLQICWGQDKRMTVGWIEYTLPMPFKDSKYTLSFAYTNMGSANGIQFRNMGTTSQTSTKFNNYNPSGETQWLAVGKWK